MDISSLTWAVGLDDGPLSFEHHARLHFLPRPFFLPHEMCLLVQELVWSVAHAFQEESSVMSQAVAMLFQMVFDVKGLLSTSSQASNGVPHSLTTVCFEHTVNLINDINAIAHVSS